MTPAGPRGALCLSAAGPPQGRAADWHIRRQGCSFAVAGHRLWRI